MSEQKTFRVVQQRVVEVQAVDVASAKAQGVREFNAYTIADNPDLKEEPAVVQEVLCENLRMNLNLADSQTGMGWATVYQDLETGHISIEIRMLEHETMLMNNILEIADLYAIGFAGIVKRNPGEPVRTKRDG